MRYLVTGGAGFIGSQLSDALIARGDEVTVLDDLSTGDASNLVEARGRPGFWFVEGSILDHSLVAALAAQADVVVHLAAAVGVKLIVERPLESLITNIRGTEIVLAAARVGCKDLDVGDLRQERRRPGQGGPRPRHGLPVQGPVVVQHGQSGGRDPGKGVPARPRRSRDRRSAVHVRRSPPDRRVRDGRPPGSSGRPWPGRTSPSTGTASSGGALCHVLDLVRALVALLDRPDAVGDVFNVGAQHEVSMNDLARVIVEMIGSSSRIVHTSYHDAYEEGFEDMERRVPDISRIHALTGWQPSRSLDVILRDVIAHERASLASASRTAG